MSRFPLRKVPGLSWPDVPLGNVGQLWAMYLELERSQWQEPAAVVEGQLSQGRTLLEHCLENVPYYQERFAAAGIRPAEVRTPADFRRFPLLQRRTYKEQFA